MICISNSLELFLLKGVVSRVLRFSHGSGVLKRVILTSHGSGVLKRAIHTIFRLPLTLVSDQTLRTSSEVDQRSYVLELGLSAQEIGAELVLR